MNSHQKKALQKNHAALCDGLELDADLEANLVQYGLFSEAKLEEIKAEKTNKQRIQRMLKVLQRRGPTAFDKILICIQDHYPWLAEKLRTSYQKEMNNTAPSSADLALERKVELLVHTRFGKRKNFCKEDKQEILNFLLLHIRQQPHQYSGDRHSENREQEILRKVFSMLTNEKKNDDTTEPFSVPAEVSLDMIASEISHISKQLRSLEKQLDYYKTPYNSDEIVKDLAAQNESILKANQLELAKLQEQLQQKDITINERNKKIHNLCSEIKELEMKCKELKLKNARHRLSILSKPIDSQSVPLKRSGVVHEKETDNGTRLPSLPHSKNISKRKKQIKFKSERFPNGIGIRGSSTHHRWRPS